MIYVFLADGFEEIEAITPIDVLRRAGIEAKVVSLDSNIIKGANGIEVKCDININEVEYSKIEGIVLPGGMPGAENLYKNEKLRKIITYCANNNKLIGAICAAPIILGRMNILNGKNACCYPVFEDELHGANIFNGSVCQDGDIVTAKGPGVSLDFALKLLGVLKGKDVSQKIWSSMQCI